MQLPDLRQVERDLCQRSLRDFTKKAWKVVEPAIDFVPNWHIDAISEHLEAVTFGQINRLVINIPPGFMKSLMCGVFWPAWSWTHTPQTKWITASYSSLVAKRDSLRARRLMESGWYQSRWGHRWRPNPDDWTKERYSNSLAGVRIATTVGGSITGEHANHQLVDDPVKPLDAGTRKVDTAALVECIEWWDETMASRVADARTATRTIIMQRLHDRDLSGHVLRRGGYEHLCLPMKYEPACVVTVPHPCSLGGATTATYLSSGGQVYLSAGGHMVPTCTGRQSPTEKAVGCHRPQ